MEPFTLLAVNSKNRKLLTELVDLDGKFCNPFLK
jgi:hypothetical protein